MTIPPPADDSARQELRARARVGTLLGKKWRLDKLLGTGGMATVYAATHRNGSRAAIKMLHPEHCAQSDLLERFFEEGYAANKVEHSGVVSVLDDGYAEDGAPFLVMELLQGSPLDLQLERGGALSPNEVLGIANQLLDVLAAAHERGVVHRDIKPANVFITTEGKIKVLDFGIARLQAPRRQQTTQAGYAMGTPAFMPPEQARGHHDKIDGRTDVWAVGATLYWLLSGRYVHEADTSNEELLAAMTTPARSVATVAPHVPRPLVDLIDRALAFDPNARFANARSMQMAVRVALVELKRFDTATLPPASTPPPVPGVSTAQTLPALVDGSVDSTPASIGPSTTSRTSGLSFRPASRLGRWAGAAAVVGGIVAIASYAGLYRTTPSATTDTASPGQNAPSESVAPVEKPLPRKLPLEGKPAVPNEGPTPPAETIAREQDTQGARAGDAGGVPQVAMTPTKPQNERPPPPKVVHVRNPSSVQDKGKPGGRNAPIAAPGDPRRGATPASQAAEAEPPASRDPLGRRN